MPALLSPDPSPRAGSAKPGFMTPSPAGPGKSRICRDHSRQEPIFPGSLPGLRPLAVPVSRRCPGVAALSPRCPRVAALSRCRSAVPSLSRCPGGYWPQLGLIKAHQGLFQAARADGSSAAAIPALGNWGLQRRKSAERGQGRDRRNKNRDRSRSSRFGCSQGWDFGMPFWDVRVLFRSLSQGCSALCAPRGIFLPVPALGTKIFSISGGRNKARDGGTAVPGMGWDFGMGSMGWDPWVQIYPISAPFAPHLMQKLGFCCHRQTQPSSSKPPPLRQLHYFITNSSFFPQTQVKHYFKHLSSMKRFLFGGNSTEKFLYLISSPSKRLPLISFPCCLTKIS